MNLSPPLRAIMLGALTMLALAPVSATARPGTQPEPIVIIAGANFTCEDGGSQLANLPALVQETYTNGVRSDAAYKWGKTPLPAGWVSMFTKADGYDKCLNFMRQARKLSDHLTLKIAQLNASRPAGLDPITKVDIVGISAGSLVSRACIANAGRENPETATPGCAALVDDWVGVVPPSHGSTSPGSIGCPWTSVTLCPAINPISDFQRKLNERYNGVVADQMGLGDETPQVASPTPIEYTTLWAGNDGLITPAASAALWGAGNYRVESVVNGTVTQATHNNMLGNSLCKGSLAYEASGTWEWIVYELLDVPTHFAFGEESPRQLATPIAPSSFLTCSQAPPGL